jgi:hypothetical protein
LSGADAQPQFRYGMRTARSRNKTVAVLCREEIVRELLATAWSGNTQAIASCSENAVAVRTEVCRPLEFLGLKLDAQANAHPKLDQDIATSDSRVRIIVIRAQEDWAIATECWRLVRTSPAALYEQQATDQDVFKSVCQNDKLSPRKLKMSGSTGIPHRA